MRNRISSFGIDGEAVLLGVDGRSDFNGSTAAAKMTKCSFTPFDVLAVPTPTVMLGPP